MYLDICTDQESVCRENKKQRQIRGRRGDPHKSSRKTRQRHAGNKRQNLQDKILHAETFLIITSLLTPVYTYVICERFVSLLALGFRASQLQGSQLQGTVLLFRIMLQPVETTKPFTSYRYFLLCAFVALMVDRSYLQPRGDIHLLFFSFSLYFNLSCTMSLF